MHATTHHPMARDDCPPAAAIALVADGEADSLSVARTEAHARVCRACARALASARALRARLGRAGAAERMPDAARERVLQRLRGVRGSSNR